MNRQGLGLSVIALACLALPVVASAQTSGSISGVVRDATGAVLPGVTVEASSPVLIEKVRSVASDDRGVYQIVNLRPGTYTVTFVLAGFNTFKREGIELTGSFAATVNADLKVGDLSETVTVSGQSPTVDISSAAKTQTLSRDLLDVIPTARTAQSFAQLIPGVTTTVPDVGGMRAMNQVYYSVRGHATNATTVMLDGIQLMGMDLGGATQAYSNTQAYEEIVFQTSGAGADVGGAGVRQNMIPRQGGNEFHGSFAGNLTRPSWQSGDITPELAAQGLTQASRTDGISGIEGGAGGRIIRDRLWWFAAARRQTANDIVPDSFYADGTPGVNHQSVTNRSLRLTWQVTPRNKFTAFLDRPDKQLSAEGLAAGVDPATAVNTFKSTLNQQIQFKWTSTLSSRLLLEVSGAQYQAYYQRDYLPEVEKAYGSPEWFATAARRDTSRGTLKSAAIITFGGAYNINNPRRFYSASATYVTGSHNLKFGLQGDFGFFQQTIITQAALVQVYQNAVPTSANVYNSPVTPLWNMNQRQLYAQDSWTFDRLTVNAGLRWEYFRSNIAEEVSGAGRFVPDRAFGPEQMPVWKTLSPRVGAVYDLFGNAKTALKFSANRYQATYTDGVADGYNPMRLQTSALTWTDLNGDDIAQGGRGCVYLSAGCEMNFSQLPANFGLITPGCKVVYTPGVPACGLDQVSPDAKREYEWAYNVGVQHELLPRVSLTGNWFYTQFSARPLVQNTLQTFADYTPVQVVSPMDGSIVTIHNVSAAKQNQVQRLRTTDADAQRWNQTFEVGFTARLPGGASLFGGTSTGRTIAVQCGFTDDPNRLNYCDQTQSGVPWQTQFKVSGSIPLPGGIQVGTSWQTYDYLYAGGIVWQITRTTRYAADCTGPCTPGGFVNPNQTAATFNVPLAAPGTILSDRIKTVDVNVGRWFKTGNLRFQPEVSVFNLFNNRAAYGVRSMNFGTSSYMLPSDVLLPRMMKLGVQVKW